MLNLGGVTEMIQPINQPTNKKNDPTNQLTPTEIEPTKKGTTANTPLTSPQSAG